LFFFPTSASAAFRANRCSRSYAGLVDHVAMALLLLDNAPFAFLLALKHPSGASRRLSKQDSLILTGQLFNLTPGRSPLMNSTPACSSAPWMAVKSSGLGFPYSPSKSKITTAGTTAAAASCAMDMFTSPRAARHWAGVICVASVSTARLLQAWRLPLRGVGHAAGKLLAESAARRLSSWVRSRTARFSSSAAISAGVSIFPSVTSLASTSRRGRPHVPSPAQCPRRAPANDRSFHTLTGLGVTPKAM
jgi:hypothetical protein